MLGSKHHVCESHTVLHMYTPESTPSALQQCAAPSYTLPRKPHNLIFIHISNYMYVFIYIYMSVCLCVCRVPPPWNLPFWYPPSSPSPEDFFRYPPQLHPRPSAADMPRSLALFSCSNPRLPFDLSPFPLKFGSESCCRCSPLSHAGPGSIFCTFLVGWTQPGPMLACCGKSSKICEVSL